MTNPPRARDWLDRREATPPPRLLERLREALDAAFTRGVDLPSQFGEAALVCLEAALRRGDDRSAALDLLAADALLTYGCEAAAELDRDEVARFAEHYGAGRLARLLPTDT